jgi:hypothetical protein
MFGDRIDPTVQYLMVLSGFYTFVFVFCYRLELKELIFTNVFIAMISYVWIITSSKLKFGELALTKVDVAINMFVFYFITFFTTFVSFVLSGIPLNTLTLTISISPIFIWTGIWLHYFRKRFY